ncbi:MAG: agmatine deiminase family protein [Bacteroidota bacterium]
MKNKLLLALSFFLFQTVILTAQNQELLPRGLSKNEMLYLEENTFSPPTFAGVTDPPPGLVRTMGEWEELDAVIITWATNSPGTTNILREIVRYAKEEVQVIIVCSNSAVVTNLLTPVGINTDNIIFIEDDFDSIWVRDYGPNTVYLNDVEERYFIDWIYNRPRPADDTIVPVAVADELGVPLYATTDFPNDLVHTGGNFMSDGMGTAFSSKLILDENGMLNQFGTSNHSQTDIENIMNAYMGIDRYVLMENLTYDPIDHIDMHMKLIDEETLIVGEYPQGRADGPQIEANIQFVLDNFKTPYGNDYEIIRIPMPPDNGNYPDDFPQGDYRTYANAIIVNKTVLVPTYEEQYDTTGLRIWQESMPGYNIQGINCNAIIGLNGAIHCITKEVGTSEPLLINHSKVREGCVDQDTFVEATIQHKSGVAAATLYYSTDTTAGYQTLAMTSQGDTWSALIPATNEETEMFYYIQAEANDGKQIVRPLTAPAGYWTYPVLDCIVDTEELASEMSLNKIYPNPASAITVVPVTTSKSINADIEVTDILGRKMETIFSGKIPVGENNYFIHANNYAAGTYLVTLKTEEQILVQKLIVK